MGKKIYYCVGEKGFWIDKQYVGRVVALKEWPYPDTEPEVMADADTLRELEMKLGDRYWVRSKYGMFGRPICRIVQKASR